MGQWPINVFPMPIGNIMPRSILGLADGCGDIGAPSNGAWPTANRALLVPFRLPHWTTIQSVTVINGAAVSGNLDGGIYDRNGRLLTSTGSVAQTGVISSQVLNFTDIVLGPGQYFAAVAMDNTTGQLERWSFSQHFARAMGLVQAVSSFPLPGSISPAVLSSDYIPHIGVNTASAQIGGDELPAGRTIHPYSRESVGASVLGFGGSTMLNMSSAAWPVANKAVGIPFAITNPTRFRAMFCYNGGAVSGNIDMGVYDLQGNKIASSGSIAQSGVNAIQAVTSGLDFVLPAGAYRMYLACNNATAQFFRTTFPNSNFAQPSIFNWNASSFPLGTLGAGAFENFLPLFGLCRETVV
jgi:hypothetical protein